jgi:NAD(P)-dependent dehydrogenase (short-subunit alcohol dehydrogenase family)
MAEQQRVAVVTGVTGGLGPAVQQAFERAGYRVAGISRKEADVTNAESVERAISQVVERLGGINVLVNVAGGFAGGKHVQETELSTWEHMLSLNLTSTFLCCRAVIPHMLSAGYGRIVNVSSRTAVQPAAGLSAYNVSKAGVVTLTETLAAELRGSNVTANAVLPSVVDTPANRAAMPTADASLWVKPEQIAAVILDLASDRWGIVSGASIPVYGEA